MVYLADTEIERYSFSLHMRITVVEDFERVCIDWMNSLGVVIDRKRDISWMGKEKRMEDFIFLL